MFSHWRNKADFYIFSANYLSASGGLCHNSARLVLVSFLVGIWMLAHLPLVLPILTDPINMKSGVKCITRNLPCDWYDTTFEFSWFEGAPAKERLKRHLGVFDFLIHFFPLYDMVWREQKKSLIGSMWESELKGHKLFSWQCYIWPCCEMLLINLFT